MLMHSFFEHFHSVTVQQKATLKTIEAEGAKHAKITGPKSSLLPELEDYERPELEKYEKPEFQKSDRPKKVRLK